MRDTDIIEGKSKNKIIPLFSGGSYISLCVAALHHLFLFINPYSAGSTLVVRIWRL